MPYERDNIFRMTGYTPGEQPAAADVVKLNTNENPYPPTPAVIEALKNISPEALRRYPSPAAKNFREAASALHRLTPDHIIATNGGDELIRLAITTFVEPGQPIGMADPSYSLYPVLAAIHDSKTFEVPLNEDWSVPDDFAAKLNAAGCPLAFIVNPHAPSGRLAPREQLVKIAAEFRGVLVVDEAYVDFVDPLLAHDTIPLVRRFDNVLLLRSMSKGYSLAGLRFGYGIGPKQLIAPMMTKTKDSYNVDVVAQALATAAIQSQPEAGQTWLAVRQERTRVAAALTALGWTTFPTQSNFVLATVPEQFGGGARAVYESLKSQHIFIRYFDMDRLRDKLRLSIGTPEENSKLLDALAAIQTG